MLRTVLNISFQLLIIHLKTCASLQFWVAPNNRWYNKSPLDSRRDQFPLQILITDLFSRFEVENRVYNNSVSSCRDSVTAANLQTCRFQKIPQEKKTFIKYKQLNGSVLKSLEPKRPKFILFVCPYLDWDFYLYFRPDRTRIKIFIFVQGGPGLKIPVRGDL